MAFRIMAKFLSVDCSHKNQLENGKYDFVNGCEYYKGEKTDISVLNCIHFR